VVATAPAGATDAPPVGEAAPAGPKPLKPLRDGDDPDASASQFGHFLHFVAAPLRAGESITVELRLLDSPQVFGSPLKVYGTPKTKAGYFTLSRRTRRPGSCSGRRSRRS
jgi:hypothetical protein